MQNIVTFFGANNPNGYLSNWYTSPLKIKFGETDHDFQNVEQAMMASKAFLMGDQDSFVKILQQPDPKKVKALGRKVKNFNPALWDKSKSSRFVLGQSSCIIRNSSKSCWQPGMLI